jgi:hypothetical protein
VVAVFPRRRLPATNKLPPYTDVTLPAATLDVPIPIFPENTARFDERVRLVVVMLVLKTMEFPLTSATLPLAIYAFAVYTESPCVEVDKLWLKIAILAIRVIAVFMICAYIKI